MGSSGMMKDGQLPAMPDRSLLVSLPPLTPDANRLILRTLEQAFAGKKTIVAIPDVSIETLRELSETNISLSLVAHTPSIRSNAGWTLSPADFVNAHQLLATHPASFILMLGEGADSLHVDSIQKIYRESLTGDYDLVTGSYVLSPHAGLVNSAILYPVSRALFGASSRFPLALDLLLSPRMADRMAAAAQRRISLSQTEAFIWPVAEAAASGFSVAQSEMGQRYFPQPTATDVTAVFAQVVGSLFADVEAKAAVWQRVRTAQVPHIVGTALPAAAASADEIGPTIDAFRSAYSNLLEVWALILPPQSLLSLKRISLASKDAFFIPDSLWARIVYDFLLAYRLRTINRNHLLGAMMPLYMAWVASHLLQISDGSNPERHIEMLAKAFEVDRPYLVSRWRWPDRFNP